MLARLQQSMVAAVLALALAWSAWAQARGLAPPLWAGVLLLILAPHAPLLALEFVLLAGFGRDPDAPRASVGQLLNAWAGEVLAAWQVFGWRQPFAADAEPDVPGGPGRTGVLLLHGFTCNRGLWTPWLRQLRARGVPCTALSLEPVFGSIDDWVPAIDAAVAELAHRTGRPPLLVAHSMGGLATRAWLAAFDADVRVAHVLTIGTPHHGTWLARFGHSRNARQMRRGSAWLTALAARETAARRARFTCFYGHADNIVFPAGTGRLSDADNRHLAGVAHVAMAFRPEVLGEVLRRLEG
jgi:triacylglycerol esterase/lipase EstA (alpha/beta hydrolase family)